ncbi:MAG: right-handed parallel beta-helix repeat-containing protein [Parcubacteria group bacterium]|jgi:hypothetical protein
MKTRFLNFNLILFGLIIFSGIFVLSTSASAATYYVKNGGNDSLSGLDDANAWETIAKVEATVTSGDMVYFRSQDVWESSITSGVVLHATSGVIYDGATYGLGTRAKFKSNAVSSYNNWSTADLNESNIIFRGFDIDSNDQTSLDGIGIGYVADKDISGITVDNCTVHNTGRYGIIVSNSGGHKTSNVQILNTETYDCLYATGIDVYASWNTPGNQNETVLVRNCISHNNLEGFSIVNDSKNVTLEYNRAYDNIHDGILVRTSPDYEGGENVFSAPINMIVRYNVIYNNADTGIRIYSPSALTMSGAFYGNLLYENGQPSIGDCAEFSVISSNATDDAFGAGTVFDIYNNTFYSLTKACTNSARLVNLGLWANLEGAEVNFKNNILYAGNFTELFIDGAPVVNHSNNLFYSTTLGRTLVKTETTDYTSTAVNTWEPTAQNTDPQFNGGTLPTGFTGIYGTDMLPNTNYFATTSGPTINNGATLGSPYDGNINTAGTDNPIARLAGAYDIGAYEYQGADITAPNAPSGLSVD